MVHLIWVAWVVINTNCSSGEATNNKRIPFLQRGGIFLFYVYKIYDWRQNNYPYFSCYFMIALTVNANHQVLLLQSIN